MYNLVVGYRETGSAPVYLIKTTTGKTLCEMSILASILSAVMQVRQQMLELQALREHSSAQAAQLAQLRAAYDRGLQAAEQKAVAKQAEARGGWGRKGGCRVERSWRCM